MNLNYKAVAFLCSFLLVLSICFGGVCSATTSEQAKRVLVIPSYNFDYLGSEWFLQGVMAKFQENKEIKVNYSQENMQLAAHPMNEEYSMTMAEALKVKYSVEKPDLIIVQYKQALEFMVRYGKDIFGDVPIVFAGLENEDYSRVEWPDNYTGVIVSFHAKRNFDLIFENHPNTKKIYIVAGASATEQNVVDQAMQQGQLFNNKAEVIALNKLPFKEMLQKIETIIENGVIMYLVMQVDSNGKILVPAQVAKEIADVAHVPVYGMLDTNMGTGITGGFLINHREMGKRAAEISIGILNGKEVNTIPVSHELIGEYAFDGRELKRWNVDEKNLPAKSKINFKEVSLWELYKWHMIGAMCVLVVQGFFIIRLLRSRSMRMRTEKLLRQRDERFNKITNNLPVALICVDRDDHIVFINEKFVEFFGYTLQDIPTVEAWMEKAHPNEEYRKMAFGFWTVDLEQSMREILDKPIVRDFEVCCFDDTVKVIQFSFALDEEYKYVVLEDITERKIVEETLQQKNMEIHRMAYFDTLTGLPNRAHMNKWLLTEMEKANSDHSGVVLSIDIDDLKMVNDTFGHSYGDALIISAGNRILSETGKGAFVARIGGDEFIAILPGAREQKSIENLATRIVEILGQEHEVLGVHFSMSVSAGIAIYPYDGTTAEEILKNSDNAMYAAKRAGKNRWRFYESSMQVDAYETMQLTNSLRHAVERGELTVYYQPQMIIKSGEVVGFEALLRWNSPEHGFVSPARFIPLAEQSGLIQSIGYWVLREACLFAQRLAENGWIDIHIAVNVSPFQLSDDDFIENVRKVLDETGIMPKQLALEITETVLMTSLEDANFKLAELKAMGVGLALDDFGTGYSSLTYLQRLPIKTLKIDKSFIDMITTEGAQPAIIAAIIVMAHIMGMIVVAEGVEVEKQIAYLEQCNCDQIQGYFVSRPVPEEEAICFLTNQG